MPGHGARREAVEVVGPPAEMMHRGGEEQGRVGHATGDDHVGAGLQRRDHRVGAEIGVGRHDAIPDAVEGGAGLVQGEPPLRQDHLGHFVPGDGGAGQVMEAQFGGHLKRGARGGDGVGGAHVRDDADAVPGAGGQDGPHAVAQVGVEPGRGVGLSGQNLARDGAFGQAFKDEVVDGPGLGQCHGRFDAVVGKARAGPDAQDAGHERPGRSGQGSMACPRAMFTREDRRGRAGRASEGADIAPICGARSRRAFLSMGLRSWRRGAARCRIAARSCGRTAC